MVGYEPATGQSTTTPRKQLYQDAGGVMVAVKTILPSSPPPRAPMSRSSGPPSRTPHGPGVTEKPSGASLGLAQRMRQFVNSFTRRGDAVRYVAR
jgi:hypothetical protein